MVRGHASSQINVVVVVVTRSENETYLKCNKIKFAQANSWLIFCHILRLRQCDNVHKQLPIIIVTQAQASVLASSVSERKFI